VTLGESVLNEAKSHLVLLGDSIFDNAIYATDAPAVIDHMRHTLSGSWNVTLIEHDGDVVANLETQIAKIPHDATHLVMSIGGNDALNALGIFSNRVDTVGEGLLHLSQICRDFQRGYRTMLWQV
jgi:hypothetical protein